MAQKNKVSRKKHLSRKRNKSFPDYFYSDKQNMSSKKNNAFPKNNSLLVEREDCSIQSVSFHWLNNIKPRIKETSYCKYQYAVVKYINPYIGNLKIYEITNKYIYDFANRLLIEGGAKHQGLSPKSVNDIICILKSILRFAADLCGVEELHFKSIQLRNTEAPLHTLTRQEQQILTQYLLKNRNERDIGILLALYTGIRLGELCALTWENINLSGGFIEIRATLTRIPRKQESLSKTTLHISTPKSENSIRKIPLPEFLIEILKENACPNIYVFLSGQPGVYIEPRNMQFYFKKTLKKAHIPDINFHALRHTFATRCVSLGFDPKTLSEILGHSSVNITMNKYVHPTMEQKKENMNRLVCL